MKQVTTEKDRLRMRLYDINNLSNPILRHSKAKSQAKFRKIEWSLTLEEFCEISGRNCFYCDEKLSPREGKGGSHLDRIDNNLGYSASNVVSCCWLCNCLRNINFTQEETKAAAQAILNVRNMHKVI